MKPGLVIFDLDGTLVDSMKVYSEKAAELISKYYGIPADRAKDLYLKTSGLPFIRQLDILFPGDERNEEVSRIFEEWKREVISEIKVEPEALQVIAELRRRGIKTAVSSNNLRKYVEAIFRNSERPDFILGWDGRGFTKGEPHIAHLEKITGLKRDSFLFVGDSPNDLKLMKSCGVPFLGITKEIPEEEFRKIDGNVTIVNRISEVLDLIDL